MSEGKFRILAHINKVRTYLNYAMAHLLHRSETHDSSKLDHPEIGINEKFCHMSDMSFGSVEYVQNLKDMKPALDHHYSVNRHHPEFFEDIRRDTGGEGSLLERMNLVDVLEMICDWKASVVRNKKGDIYESIEKNQKRFEYTDELKSILINTARMLDGADN